PAPPRWAGQRRPDYKHRSRPLRNHEPEGRPEQRLPAPHAEGHGREALLALEAGLVARVPAIPVLGVGRVALDVLPRRRLVARLVGLAVARIAAVPVAHLVGRRARRRSTRAGDTKEEGERSAEPGRARGSASDHGPLFTPRSAVPVGKFISAV